MQQREKTLCFSRKVQVQQRTIFINIKTNLYKMSKEITITEKELVSLIDLKCENDLLFSYLRNNPLPFCLEHIKDNPFNVKYHTTSVLIKLIEMINNGRLILNKNKQTN